MDPRLNRFGEELGSFIESCTRSGFVLGVEEAGWFEEKALRLFRIQAESNPCYRRLLEHSRVSAPAVERWEDVPCVPTAAFKELAVTSLPENDRSRVFLSSGTTQSDRGRHFHSKASLDLYEKSLLGWFQFHLLGVGEAAGSLAFFSLLPSAEVVPDSSLIHMFDVVGRSGGYAESNAFGELTDEGGWAIAEEPFLRALRERCESGVAVCLVGTAFSFVQVLDMMAGVGEHFQLPPGSRILETGGYKGRTRELSKEALYDGLFQALGVAPDRMVSEYGMSELSSQGYDHQVGTRLDPVNGRRFRFPPWTRVRVVSPETGLEVGVGETGLIQVFDLANIGSVMAIQTEDLGRRFEDGVALLGRSPEANFKGCSLMPEA